MTIIKENTNCTNDLEVLEIVFELLQKKSLVYKRYENLRKQCFHSKINKQFNRHNLID